MLEEDLKIFRQEIAAFCAAKIKPHVLEMDEKEEMRPEIIKGLFEMGLMGIEVPEIYGGAGGSFTMACLAIEEVSKVDPSVGVFIDVQNTLVNNIFGKWASDAQKKKYFPQLVQDKVGCFCLSEADSGSDAFALRTRAQPEKGGYLLTGKKMFITNAKEASILIVFANVNPEEGYKGITAFILEKGMPGLSLGKKEKKLGIRASSTCEVVMEQVFVPKENILGELGKGYKVAIETLNEGRIGIAAQMLGLAQGAFNGALSYARERKQFGKTIDQFQGVQFELARLACQIEYSKHLVFQAALLKDQKKPFAKEAAIAKYQVSQVAEEVASKALEIYGGYGFIKEFPAEKFYRDAKIGKIYEGTSNLQLQTIFKLL